MEKPYYVERMDLSRKGGNLNEEQIYELADQDSEKQKEKLSELYRRFTDQFMITLKNMGAA